MTVVQQLSDCASPFFGTLGHSDIVITQSDFTVSANTDISATIPSAEVIIKYLNDKCDKKNKLLIRM